MKPLLFCIACASGFALFANPAIPQGTRADYERSASYAKRTADRVFRDEVTPQWFGPESNRFWYRRRTGPKTHDFVLVDPAEKTRKSAFDHDALARFLSEETGKRISSKRLQLIALEFAPDLQHCRFRSHRRSWRFQIPEGPLEEIESDLASSGNPIDGLQPLDVLRSSVAADQPCEIHFENRLEQPLEIYWYESDRRRKHYGTVAPGRSYDQSTYQGHVWLLQTIDGQPVAAFSASLQSRHAKIDDSTPVPSLQMRHRNKFSNRDSPDGRWRVRFVDHNVALHDRRNDVDQTLTTDGEEMDSYESRVWWSPDSKHFVTMKVRQGEHREIAMIESAPKDSIHSRVINVPYVKPGDELDHPRLVLFSVQESDPVLPNPILIDDKDFSNPFHINHIAWHQNGNSFSFVYNQRGHQTLRVISVDVETATPRIVVDETSDTFVCYSQKTFLHRIDETNELIWMSERSGWNHLYRIDQVTGEVKNAITSGEWVVRKVEKIDDEARQIWLRVSGMDPIEDPYHVHLIRVGFDGKDLVRLTRGDGNHEWQFSPDGKYLIDTYSRVDLAPRIDLRDAKTGELICHLEKADDSKLLDSGWVPPERFVAKGRDGETDIHGIIIRPTHFDPATKYPVLEAIYAGPHSAFVPKSYGRHVNLYEMAELGFIVVKIDGMGTNHRSKAFHDVCWKNIADSGFPDRIAWMKAAAKDRPEMDLSRVGIWGGSAGGQSAMRALIAHGDFYKAASADCGCHDNRVDKIWWNEQWMGWPIGPHYEQQSNVTQAHRLEGDLLLIWGELDKNVDPASSMQVVDALIKADKDFEQLIVPGAGHGAAGHRYAKRRQADFFVRKLWKAEPRRED